MRATQSVKTIFRGAPSPSSLLRVCGRTSAIPCQAPLRTLTARLPPAPSQLAGRNTAWEPTPRYFSHSVSRSKKEGKPRGKDAKGTTGAKPSKTAAEGKGDGKSGRGDKDRVLPNPEEPFDLADVEHGFDRVSRRHEDDLKQLRSGGRFNPETIGAVLVRPDKSSGATYPLRELAQVAPKGARSISILVSEAGLVKAVQSAILNSEHYNQQPQVAEDNELELLMKVEPEPVDALTKRAKDILQKWRDDIRAERHKRDVVNKRWKDDKVLTTDDKRRLDKDLQKVQDARMTAINQREKEVLKRIASSEGS